MSEKSEPKKSNLGGARAGAGRKPFQPTEEERKQAESMAGYGVPHEQIAVLIRGGIDADTLKKYFKKELQAGKAKASAKVGRTLFQKATDGDDTTAQIWWTKTQMGWKETKQHEVGGLGGGPVHISIAPLAVADSTPDLDDDGEA